MTTIIYTDGACSGNPGKGGWGLVILRGNKQNEYYGREENTTNNRMEMTAIIQGISKCNDDENIMLYSDSKYVLNGIKDWMLNWKQNGWKTTNNNKPVKNKDLWLLIDECIQQKNNIKFSHVKAHSGNYYNDRADYLAKNCI
jgi:ribonuclease HI